MAERVNSSVDSVCNPFLGSMLIKTYSIQFLLRCHRGQRSLCEPAANLGSPQRMIVTEASVGTARGATRRCSSGVASAGAWHDTRRSSARGRALSTAPSGRRYASSAAGTCRRFPVRWREKYLTDNLVCFRHVNRQYEHEQQLNLILESCGLLLKPCCFEVIDDVSNPPVGWVQQLTVLHWAVTHSHRHTNYAV